MSTLVLDTNVVSFFMKRHRLAEGYRALVEGHTLAISFMSVGELYEGAYRAKWGHERLALLEKAVTAYVVIPYGFEISRQWGAIRFERREQTISVDDAWIAATARAHRLPLVTHNPRNFRGIEMLKVLTEA